MARTPQISARDDLPADKQGIADAIAGSRGSVRGPFPTLLNSPEVAGRIAHLGTYLRYESTLSAEHREMAILTAARELDSNFEWGPHVILAREAGVREQAIDVIANRSPTDALADDEARIIDYGRELLRDHRVSEAKFEAARSRFGNQGVTELTVTMGYYAMLHYQPDGVRTHPRSSDGVTARFEASLCRRISP